MSPFEIEIPEKTTLMLHAGDNNDLLAEIEIESAENRANFTLISQHPRNLAGVLERFTNQASHCDTSIMSEMLGWEGQEHCTHDPFVNWVMGMVSMLFKELAMHQTMLLHIIGVPEAGWYLYRHEAVAGWVSAEAMTSQ